MHTSLTSQGLLPTIYYYYYYYYESNTNSIWNFRIPFIFNAESFAMREEACASFIFSSYMEFSIYVSYNTMEFHILTSNVPFNNQRLFDFNTIVYGLYDY